MIGLPLLNGFVGEFLILSSTFSGVSHGWAVVATLGVILSAAYMLCMVQRVFYGPESALAASAAADLRAVEQFALWPLAVLMLVMGVAPNLWLRAIATAPGPTLLEHAQSIGSLAQPDVSSAANNRAELGEVQR
jgi:NADH-quinone oxidoreductase subunit M